MNDRAPTVLLADESPFFLNVEKQFLRRLPVTIAVAESAEMVLARCREDRPDLVYLAWELSGGCGAECCRSLKADPDLRTIPVILVCKEDAGEELAVCREAGCDALVTKPLDRRRFVDIGRSFLGGVGESRRPCLVATRVRSPEQSFAAKGLDLSPGGIFIASAEPLLPGTPVELEVQMSRPDQEGPWIRCSGAVGWLNTRENPIKQAHPAGFGVRFTALPDWDRRLLSRYLKSLGN